MNLSLRQKIYLPFKRFFDIVCALMALLVFSWLYIIIAILIVCTSKGGFLFKQKRVGKNKKLFTIYKFRTMKKDTPKDVPIHLLENPNQYITKIGKFLRKTSLDEIPQAINILIGQMSVIGPRPALWNQNDLIAERDLYCVNGIKPGLSGWAQVNGREKLSINEKAKIDGDYIKKFNIWFDIKIIFKTLFLPFRSKKQIDS